MTDDEISKKAIEWVRNNKEILYKDILGNEDYSGMISPPAASFMAGTPGAGKTEVSKRFIEQFDVRPIRIDADEFRLQIPGYNGKNSSIIQPAASLAVDKILEKVFQNKYPFLLDGTFAVGKATQNLKRAIRRGYTLQIFFVYQDPVQAWEFTKIREIAEGRRVPKDIFINSYFAARENVNMAKRIFGEEVTVYMVIKDYILQSEKIIDNVSVVENNLPKLYTKEELESVLI